MQIRNVDGGEASVSVGGLELATVACGETTTVAITQPQPWQIVVLGADGSELLRQTLSSATEQGVVVRSDGALAGPLPLPGGPPPLACPE